jgi:hypothetical protein
MKRAAAIVLLLAGSAWAGPSEVIFPPQQMPLRFDHAKHLAKKIECDFCHETAPKSRNASDNLIPGEEVCSTCHPIDREEPDKVSKSATACGFCHVGFQKDKPVERVLVPTPNLRFDHQVHVERGIACTHCHGDMSKVTVATRAQLPEMPLCLGCHNSGRGKLSAPSRCRTCHLTQPDGTLQQSFASGQLRPSGILRGDSHTIEFRTNHKAVAQNDARYCESCHRQDFCLTCHNGVVKPFDFHGNDYVSRHPIDARRNDPDCNACHRRQTFCLSCHERLGVTDIRTAVDGAFKPIGPKQFHPNGWADPVAAHQPNHHAWQAQRNLKQCVGCHRQETCLQCHADNASAAGAVGKMWVNPHPPNWRGSNRCQALADRDVRMCLRCHQPADTHLSCK